MKTARVGEASLAVIVAANMPAISLSVSSIRGAFSCGGQIWQKVGCGDR